MHARTQLSASDNGPERYKCDAYTYKPSIKLAPVGVVGTASLLFGSFVAARLKSALLLCRRLTVANNKSSPATALNIVRRVLLMTNSDGSAYIVPWDLCCTIQGFELGRQHSQGPRLSFPSVGQGSVREPTWSSTTGRGQGTLSST